MNLTPHLVAYADHLDGTARRNGIGPERFATMNALRTAADALYQTAELIAEGRHEDDPDVALWRRVAESQARQGRAS